MNATAWIIKDIYSGSQTFGTEAGYYLDAVVNDVLLFDAWSGVTNDPRSIWAYNPTNSTAWELQSADSVLGDSHVTTSSTSCGQPLVVGDVAYFCATGGSNAGGYELWAYNTSNETTWLVTDIQQPGDSHPGKHMFEVLGDTLYFSAADGSTGIELWAYDTSNRSTWQVADINSGSFHSNPGQYMTVVFGDTLYFSAKTEATNQELYAYDTSNQSLWLVEDLRAGSQSSFVGEKMALVAGNKLVFNAKPSGTTSYLYGHEPSQINHMTNTGGPVTSWAINSTNLPTGLTFSTTNGTVYGTPTELWPQTSYMVWANNSVGSSVAYLNITVVDELPTLSYSPSTLVLTKGNQSSDLPLNATLTGPGEIMSWQISATLPAGLNFGTSNGTIWGTPTSLMTLKTFTIWANNSGGSSSATVNITVNDELPNISYSPDWFVLTNNTAMSPTATPTNSGGAIPSTVIDSTGNVGLTTSIAIDSSGYKHISYLDGTNDDLKYATDKTGSWVTVSVDTTGNVGIYTSIAIDSNDALHISYYDDTNDDLKYATCSSGCTTASNWDKVSVDSTGDVGYYTSIAIDSNDALHISYNDDTSDDLRYATCSSGCTTASNWDIGTVDTTGNVGRFTSIAIDSNDAVHISYMDLTNYDLKYATCSSGCTTASNWDKVSIDTTGIVGYYTSIAIDSNDALHISYYESTNDDLKYATCSSGCTTASNWDKVSVDTTGNVGYYTSIAIDSNDAVHISYLDFTNIDLKYATCSSGCTTASNWDIVSVDTTGNVGYWTSIAIDSNDAVHISYYDSGYDDLKYIVLDSSSNIYGYSVSPDLPAGLSLNAFTGEISGTPTELSTNTTYTITARNSGGVNTTTITIVVEADLADISIDPSSVTVTRGYDIAPITANNTGAEVLTWAISPALPSGLSFENGTVYGRPLVNMSATTFTVYANNSAGSATTTLTLTINEPTPNVDYSPDNYTLTNGTSYTITPTLFGETGSIQSIITNGSVSSSACAVPFGDLFLYGTKDHAMWAFNTTLPESSTNPYLLATDITFTCVTTLSDSVEHNGTLYFQASTNATGNELWKTDGSFSGTNLVKDIWAGTISSAPRGFFVHNETVHFYAQTSYTSNYLWETDGTASGTTTFTYSGGTLANDQHWTEYNGSFYARMEFSSTGREVAKFDGSTVSLLVDLTPGMNFGLPKMTNPHSFTVHDGWLWFLGAGCLYRSNGTAAGTTALVCDAGTDLVVFKDELYFGRNADNKGLELWKTDGTVSGTSLVVDAWVGTNGGLVGPSFISTDDLLYFEAKTGTANADRGLWVTDGTTAGSRLLRDGLWANLHLSVVFEDVVYFSPYDFSSGSSSYVSGLWSTDGTSNGTVHYMGYGEDTQAAHPALSNVNGMLYFRYFTGTAYTFGLMHNASGAIVGQPSSWSISPSLPDGLNFGSNNGTIWGTPTALNSTAQYTITATNANGSSTTTINITVVDDVPVLSYTPASVELTNNTAHPDFPLLATVTGSGVITSWAINDSALPTGVFFGTTNGTFWGTPTQLWPETTYTVWANNSGGSTSATVTISVVDQVPTLAYSPSSVEMTNNTASSDFPLAPSLSGPGDITSWAINDSALPTGVFFGTTNGTFWGVPTQLWPARTYTVWANNSGGSTSATVTLEVVDQVPVLSYSPDAVDMVNNTAHADMPLEAVLTGPGDITSWAINDSALPSGVFFGSTNGTFWGTPTELWPETTYTVWANNSGGSTSATVTISVVDQVPVLSYSPNAIELRNNTAHMPTCRLRPS